MKTIRYYLLTFLFVAFLQNGSLIAAEASLQGKWDEYYQKTIHGKEPRYTLFLAQKYFELENKKPGLAVDLGTGVGTDTLFLLKNGWNVLAIDAETSAIEILLSRVNAEDKNRLDTAVAPFSEMLLPDNLDLINASFSLPFCRPTEFSDCWNNVVDHLAIGGRFSGHFFGDQDDRKTNPGLTFHSEEALLKLFEEHFEIEYIQIEKGFTPLALYMNHSHIFHVVAKKVR